MTLAADCANVKAATSFTSLVGETQQDHVVILQPEESLVECIGAVARMNAGAGIGSGSMLRHSEPLVDANRFIAAAESWGDVGAASGPLFAVLANGLGALRLLG